MNRFATLLIALTMSYWGVAATPIALPQEQPIWEVYFSPRGGCTNAIIKELNRAKNTVLVQAYSFTSAPIAKALVNAHKRGVKVEVILDNSQRTEKYSSADFLVNSGIRTYIDAAHAIAHNKVIIIDGEVVITGSFNFTKAAEENNAENLLIVRDNKMAEMYRKNWNDHVRHSEVYLGKGLTKDSRAERVIRPIVQEKSPTMNYYSAVWSK